jgi:uncharacterized protein YcnI
MNRWRRSTAAVLTGVAGLTLLAAGTAQAHVRVSAPKAVVGQPATFDFQVPSEEQVATTVRLSVTIPADVKVTQIPAKAAWISVMAKDTAGDTVVTWTAQQSGIAPAASVAFLVRAAALPNRPTVAFDVVQTYSNGDIVYWNQKQVGATEPPYPAPTLKLAGSASGAAPDGVAVTPAPQGTTPSDSAAPQGAAATPSAAPQVTAAATAGNSGVPGWLLGLAIGGGGVIGAAVAIAAVFRLFCSICGSLQSALRSTRRSRCRS